MKTSNYLAKLPQEVTIKFIETHQGYDPLTLKVPKQKQRLCPHCGFVHCVIKDSGFLQTVRHIPINNRGTEISFHKHRLLCKDCNTTFYETPYWIHPSLPMTWALYDSILLDLMEPIPQTEIARKNCVTESIVQSVLKTIDFGLPAHLPETINIHEFKGNSGVWSRKHHKWYLNKYHCNISDGDSHAVIDILDQISTTYLHKYFQQFALEERKRVRYFCCDMSNGFVSLAKKDGSPPFLCFLPFRLVFLPSYMVILHLLYQCFLYIACSNSHFSHLMLLLLCLIKNQK